jgi:hypothetical protein
VAKTILQRRINNGLKPDFVRGLVSDFGAPGFFPVSRVRFWFRRSAQSGLTRLLPTLSIGNHQL